MMLIMRNSRHGMIWQAYQTQNQVEVKILTANAEKNGFLVEQENDDYTEETLPGWRDTPEWKDCLQRNNHA
jgi:hypothetical protein